MKVWITLSISIFAALLSACTTAPRDTMMSPGMRVISQETENTTIAPTIEATAQIEIPVDATSTPDIAPLPAIPKKLRLKRLGAETVNNPIDSPIAVQEEPIKDVGKIVETWQPNEALIIRGKQLIIGLQRDIGREPNVGEMQQRLQTHMGLSLAQAQKLMAELGL